MAKTIYVAAAASLTFAAACTALGDLDALRTGASEGGHDGGATAKDDGGLVDVIVPPEDAAPSATDWGIELTGTEAITVGGAKTSRVFVQNQPSVQVGGSKVAAFKSLGGDDVTSTKRCWDVTTNYLPPESSSTSSPRSDVTRFCLDGTGELTRESASRTSQWPEVHPTGPGVGSSIFEVTESTRCLSSTFVSNDMISGHDVSNSACNSSSTSSVLSLIVKAESCKITFVGTERWSSEKEGTFDVYHFTETRTMAGYALGKSTWTGDWWFRASDNLLLSHAHKSKAFLQTKSLTTNTQGANATPTNEVLLEEEVKWTIRGATPPDPSSLVDAGSNDAGITDGSTDGSVKP